jgi:hypothetical protein
MLAFGRMLTFALATVAGVAASQLPEFGQQYRQRLGGAVDALGKVVAEFDADAARNGLDRVSALDEMEANPAPLVQDRAVSMARAIMRYERLAAQEEAYRTAGPFARLATIATHYDPQLVSATLDDYEPAVPTTIEGGLTAAGGFFTVMLAGFGLGGLFRRRRPA